MKVICGLGNPGAGYARTRHNVGWWAVEHAQRTWNLPPFAGLGSMLGPGGARGSHGRLGEHDVLLIEPLTYMNRSGTVLAPLRRVDGFALEHDLLVVVDDTALDVGRLRLRARGSAGGHNGLRSIEAELATQEYARLRIGVGAAPPDVDLVAWVLSPFDPGEERQIRELMPDVVGAFEVWLADGVGPAANRYNR